MKKKITFEDIREAALNPSVMGLKTSQIIELITAKSKKKFERKLKKFVKENET